jgi:hypothetical protein
VLPLCRWRALSACIVWCVRKRVREVRLVRTGFNPDARSAVRRWSTKNAPRPATSATASINREAGISFDEGGASCCG